MSRFGFEEKADKLVRAFNHFDVEVKVVAVTVARRVITFELKTRRCQKTIDILNLASEIRYFTNEEKLRIVLDGYGENRFGVEMPIEDMGDYAIEDLYKANTFFNNDMELPIYIGTDIRNRMVFDDLYYMSSILIAGRSGSGKTAFLRSVIASIIKAKTPDEAKFVIFDPKGCEWNWAKNLSYLECPLIKGLKAGNHKIKWIAEELKRRQELFATTQRKNIIDYNSNEPNKIPHLIVMFDEISDYLLLGDANIENWLASILIGGRNAGIHLIISTMHTTERVVNPLIKAHCLARISFEVETSEESELILDIAGAEYLHGEGDAFYKSFYHPTITRLQTSYVHETAVRSIIPKRNETFSDFELLKLCDDTIAKLGTDNPDSKIIQDENFKKVLKHCISIGAVTTRDLQLEFDFGYAKAARYCDAIKKVLGMPLSEKIPFD